MFLLSDKGIRLGIAFIFTTAAFSAQANVRIQYFKFYTLSAVSWSGRTCDTSLKSIIIT
jgi:hypothetical protein